MVLNREADGFFHPSSEEAIRDLILMAREQGLQVRVRGSGHSTSDAIYTDGHRHQTVPMVDILLDKYSRVISFDADRKRVTVEAGCRFARDPRDATKRSTDQNGLCYQIDRRGWALPSLAGVSHQTLSGFFSTGSEGGSLKYSIGSQLVGLRFIDGTGVLHDVSEESDPELFHAAGVSLGLLGVITQMTFQCIDRYDVIGSEETLKVKDAGVDLFGRGENDLRSFFAETDYARLLWWPQPGVDKVVVWKARRMVDADYTAETGPRDQLARRPYLPFPAVFGTTVPMQTLAGRALKLLNPSSSSAMPHAVRSSLYNAFVSETQEPAGFRDSWWQGIPMDNLVQDRLLPTTFTELWVPMAKAQVVMERLRDHYARHGFDAAGNFVAEFYASPASKFWLSPSYGEDQLRINLFWFSPNRGDPRIEYFPQFWALLKDLGFRLHWGKFLFRDAAQTVAHLRPLYPRWDDFFRLRDRLDPDQVFVTSYWRRHLGLPEPRLSRPAPALPVRSRAETLSPVLKWPMPFKLRPATPTLAERARYVFDNTATIDAPPDLVYRVFSRSEGGDRWALFFRGVHWVTEDRDGPGSTVDEIFTFMALRLRVIHAELGRRRLRSIDACSLPLANEMLEQIECKPMEDGRTLFRWRIHYEPRWYMAPVHGLARWFFGYFFRRSTQKFAEYFNALPA